MKHILSYGGGVNSSALFFYILDKKLPLDLVVFADTGEELPQTYEAVKEMEKICKNKNIEFATVQSEKGNLYEYYFNKKAVMSMLRRDCTSKFKVSPIRKHIRKRYGKKETFKMYIGIAWDEATRVRDSDVKYIENIYPFVDDKITRDGNYEILKSRSFKAFKSGCIGCMYNKKKEWVKMIIDNPKEFERHLKLDENNSGFPKVLLAGNYKLRDLYNSYKNQETLTKYEETEPSCDVQGSCFL